MKPFIALLLAVVAVGCGSARRAEPIIGPITLHDSERKGRMVYEQHCFRCHDQGQGGLAPALNNKPLPGFLIRLQVRRGLGAMPAFSPERISDEELGALVDYLAALRRAPR